MISLFQIGYMNLFGYIEPTIEQAWQAQGKPEDLLDSARVIRPSARHLAKSRDFRATITAYNDQFRTRDHLYNQLINLVGYDTDIIAFDDFSTHVEFSRDPLSEFDRNSGNLLWLHTRGQITEVKPSYQGDVYHWEFNVRVATDPYWKPLNNIQWQMIDASGFTTHYIAEQTIDTPYTPTLFPSANGLTRILNKRPQMFHFTKMENWGDQFEPDWYATTILSASKLGGHYTAWSTDTYKAIPIVVDYNLWSAPPQTVYVFKNLPASGTITIEVERDGGIWEAQTITTTIDLATVDTAVTAAGYTTTATDKLIVGDTHWMPGFVLRDETKLTQIADAVSRDGGAWAGQLLPGDNRIIITVPATVEWFIGNINRRG